jgi:hypothetical protein
MGTKYTFSSLMLTILATFLALVAFSVPVKAQIADEPNYEYRVLEEKDFNLFINFAAHVAAEKDPELFYSENKVTEEYTQDVVMKISLNQIAKSIGSTNDLEQEFGKSAVFTASESALYDKYQPQIITALKQLGLGEME